MRLLLWKWGVVCVAVALFLASPAAGTPITGVLNVSGSVTVTGTVIDWWPLAGGSGDVTVGSSSTGSFAGIGGTGTMLDLDSTVSPTNTPLAVPNFLLLANAPTLSFELNFIFPGMYGDAECGLPPAPGQHCTPLLPLPRSPFNLTNLAGGSSEVSMILSGVVYELGNPDPVSTFTGVYTAQFVGKTYQQILTDLASGGSVSTTFSASFDVESIPEPATEFLIFGALAALSLVRRFRKN